MLMTNITCQINNRIKSKNMLRLIVKLSCFISNFFFNLIYLKNFNFGCLKVGRIVEKRLSFSCSKIIKCEIETTAKIGERFSI